MMHRSRSWAWWVSGLLLLATMLNYMDRQTLANLSVRITDEMSLNQEQYGDLELVFGWAFALGSITFGVLADRLPIRLLYPLIVIAWSTVGLITGYAQGYEQLFACRALLGFFEAGHWPCALLTTQAVFDQRKRMLGNSLLQSGGAVGAILTPVVIRLIVGDNEARGAWRTPFVVIGALGAAWVIAWLLLIRRGDVEKKDVSSDAPDSRNVSSTETRRNFWWQECLANPKFWAMVPVVVSINITWQLIRAWLPKFLQQGRGIPESQSLWFNSAYYISADIGCISAGAIAMWLATRGMKVHRARVSVFLCCAVVVAIMTNAAAVLPRGPALYSVLLVVAAASMGLFPCYYSLAQDVSSGNVGKASGLLATIGWLVASPMQKIFGRLVDSTGSFDTGLALVGIPPVIAILWLMAIWPRLETTDATPSMNQSSPLSFKERR